MVNLGMSMQMGSAPPTEIEQGDLVIHWKVEEGEGTDITDETGNNDTTIINTHEDFWANTAGDGSTAVGTFDGPDAGAYLTAVTDPVGVKSSGDGISIMAAVYPDTLLDGSTYYILEGEIYFYLSLAFTAPTTYTLTLGWQDDEATWYKVHPTLPTSADQSWFLLQAAWTYGVNSITFYINDTAQSLSWDNDPTEKDPGVVGTLYVGACNSYNADTGVGSGVQWMGRAGDFALWDDELTAAEMISNYNALAEKYGI